jgi:hypothetical protein
MIQEELYNKTVDILVAAYFNDTLVHDDCSACAVGNIIAHHMGCDIVKSEHYHDLFEWHRNGQYIRAVWGNVFITNSTYKYQEKDPSWYTGSQKEQIDATGYTWQELAKVEFAFETAPKGHSGADWMFNGLMAVVDTLDEIHQNDNTMVAATSKQRFTKAVV